MYANFTEETCTGTGGTLTLTGVTTGNIAFSLSYADGDLVAYALEDSAGVIKVAGIGTYNTTGNTITRNDTFNYNGTVVDKNPSTNITLSAGSHTVRCDVVALNLNNSGVVGTTLSGSNINGCGPDALSGNDLANTTAFAGQLIFQYVLFAPRRIRRLGIEVQTADIANPNTRIGIYSVKAGLPSKVLIDEVINVSSSGSTYATLATEIILPAGVYIGTVLTESSSVIFKAYIRSQNTFGGFGTDTYSSRNNMFTKAAVTGSLSDNPTGFSTTTDSIPFLRTTD